MRHVCIKCGEVWLPEHEIDEGETTADLCDECLKFWIRGRQRSEGCHDCYRRAVEICSRKRCLWFQLCCETFLIDDMLKEHANV